MDAVACFIDCALVNAIAIVVITSATNTTKMFVVGVGLPAVVVVSAATVRVA